MKRLKKLQQIKYAYKLGKLFQKRWLMSDLPVSDDQKLWIVLAVSSCDYVFLGSDRTTAHVRTYNN